MKKLNLFFLGIPLVVFGVLMYVSIDLIDACEFTAKDYKFSNYYNQTHQTVEQAKKSCHAMQDQYQLVPIGMIILGLILMLIGIFPGASKPEDFKKEDQI